MKKIVAIALLLIFSFSMIIAYGGEGEGGGANKAQPLTVISSSITSGQKDVPIAPRITLEFNKNVVNMAVSSNNKSCFSMQSESGETVAVSVEMGDDQVDPSIKRIITIVPEGKLKAGEKYTLTISGNLMAKNGVTAEQATNISFTTVMNKENQISSTSKDGQVEPLIENKKSIQEEQTGMDPNIGGESSTGEGIKEPVVDSGDTQLDTVANDENKDANENRNLNSAIKVFFVVLIIVGIGILGVLAWRGLNGKK